MPESSSSSSNRDRNGNISLDWKTLITIGIAACAVIIYVVTSVIQGNQSIRDIAQLRVDMLASVGEVKTAIITLPDQRAKVDIIQQRLVDDARWHSVMEDRIQEVKDKLVNITADVDGIKRASGVNLRK
mgnify:CR=1 FL=1